MQPGEVGGRTTPSSSARSSRARWNAASASACRPSRYNAEHEERPRLLSERVLGEHELGLARGPARGAEREQGLDPFLLRAETEFIQTSRLRHERGSVGDVRQGGPAPQCEGVLERPEGHRRIDRERTLRLTEQRVEPGGVQVDRMIESR